MDRFQRQAGEDPEGRAWEAVQWTVFSAERAEPRVNGVPGNAHPGLHPFGIFVPLDRFDAPFRGSARSALETVHWVRFPGRASRFFLAPILREVESSAPFLPSSARSVLSPRCAVKGMARLAER